MKYIDDIKNHLKQEITEQYSNEIFKQYAFSFDIYSKKLMNMLYNLKIH